MKWDTEIHADHDPINMDSRTLKPWPDGKVPEKTTFWRIRLAQDPSANTNAKCSSCQGLFTGQYFWYAKAGSYYSICEKCGERLQTNVSSGFTHRCRECTLMRCSRDNSICEECAGYMAQTSNV